MGAPSGTVSSSIGCTDKEQTTAVIHAQTIHSHTVSQSVHGTQSRRYCKNSDGTGSIDQFWALGTNGGSVSVPRLEG